MPTRSAPFPSRSIDRRGTHRRSPRIAALLVAALAIAGCGSATASPSRGGDPSHKTAARVAESSNPADEICEDMTRDNVANQLTEGRLLGAPVRTKSGSVTTCTYRITGGSLRLAVDERAGDSAARTSFAAAKRAATSPVKVPLLGSDAFTGDDGTTVTVKDDKVLTVDPTDLPAGNDRTQIAQSISFEVLTCWTH
jgi:hypothetical protein